MCVCVCVCSLTIIFFFCPVYYFCHNHDKSDTINKLRIRRKQLNKEEEKNLTFCPIWVQNLHI
jgi:hypothetical protein